MALIIAVIGTRDPTPEQAEMCKSLVSELSKRHMIISGGAVGIDLIALGNASQKRPVLIVLPWESYNRHELKDIKGRRIVYDERIHHVWKESVFKYHPKPEALSNGAIRLHARNYGIIVDSDLVIAFPSTRGGGTAQGIKIANGLSKKTFIFPPNEDYRNKIEDIYNYIEETERKKK